MLGGPSAKGVAAVAPSATQAGIARTDPISYHKLLIHPFPSSCVHATKALVYRPTRGKTNSHGREVQPRFRVLRCCRARRVGASG